MKNLLMLILLFGSILAQAMPVVGSSASGVISENTELGEIEVPLPAGKWTLVYADSFDGPRMQRMGTDITGYYGESSNKFEELVLIQDMGSRLGSMIDIKFNITNELKAYSDNLCTNRTAYFTDDYGTKLWSQKCLEVGSAINAINSDQSIKGRAIRAYISEHHLSTPSTFVAMNYGQYDRNGHRIDVRLNVNPLSRDQDDNFESGGLSEWNHEVIAKYPKKLEFMNQFTEFAKAYSNKINQIF